MHHLRLVPLATVFLSIMLAAQSTPLPLVGQPPVAKTMAAGDLSRPDPAKQARLKESYGKLPLSFEANQGQTDARVKFVSRTPAYSLFLTGDEAVLALHGVKAAVEPRLAASPAASTSIALPTSQPTSGRATESFLRMKLRNANAASKITGMDELPGTSNYFIGNDQGKWRTSIPTYARVKYEEIYSGIDLVYYGNQRQLEYDFIVAPGADPRRIAFDVSGAKRIRRDKHGDLVLQMKSGDRNDEIRWHKPVVYQEKDGTRELVAAHYAITNTNRVAFEVAKYDRSRPLYIDPLIYSTYLGGSGLDEGHSIAVDSAGNAYVTGETTSTAFPTVDPLQVSNGGSYNVFVAKINSAGSALLYSTYLGGEVAIGYGIAVDWAGDAYITGPATAGFPTTPGAFQTVPHGGYDAFVAQLNPTGSALVYSTYLGGTGDDIGSGIAVDSAGNAYVTGDTISNDFPTLHALQPNYGGRRDAYVAKINPAGSALVYSTYLGGSNEDIGSGIAIDSAGNAYITGQTSSHDFPTLNALQPNYGGSGDAYLAKINPAGSALVYSTYLGGGASDGGTGIAADDAGNAYVTGYTSGHFPTKNPLQPTKGGGFSDAFVSKINPSGSALVYSTYLGGKVDDIGVSIAVDSAGSVYVTGYTTSTNFPTKNPLQATLDGTYDAFVSKINPEGSALVYSTYLGGSGFDAGGGIAADSLGRAYVVGFTNSNDFPTMSPLQPTSGGGYYDAFISELFIAAATTTTLSSSPNPSTYGQAVTFTAVITASVGSLPDGETVTFMKGTTVLGTGALSGGSASFTTSTLKVGTPLIKAVYGGDSNFAGSTSKAVKQLVNKATTTTTLTSSQNPSNVGQSVTFTASVVPQFSGQVIGTVTFYDGTTALKTSSVSGGGAKFTTSTLTHGTHSITATYNGNSNFDSSSSAALTQTVN